MDVNSATNKNEPNANGPNYKSSSNNVNSRTAEKDKEKDKPSLKIMSLTEARKKVNG